MDNQPDFHAALARLERQVARLKALVVFLIAGAGLTLGAAPTLFPAARAQQPDDRVLRVRGIVIEDEGGRERVLIGAPIPSASNRVRTNEERVRKLWGPRYPNVDQYMGFYKDYRHSTNGIVILDENGFDRVAIGDPVPDPNIGRRIGPSTGVVINDEQGSERTGYGLLNVNGSRRVVLGMDTARGVEGLTLVLNDEGSTGMAIRDPQRLIYVGTAPATAGVAGAQQSFHGLLVRAADGIRFVQNSDVAR